MGQSAIVLKVMTMEAVACRLKTLDTIIFPSAGGLKLSLAV